MAREGTEVAQINMVTEKQREDWKKVKAHFGPGWSNSRILNELVRIKAYEIEGQESNRFRLARVESKLDSIEEKLNQAPWLHYVADHG